MADTVHTPPPAVTAELCARAIVASAGVYEDSPELALTAPRGLLRRSLSPAASALGRALGDDERAARLLGVSVRTVMSARSRREGRFPSAERAAAKAILRALKLGGPRDATAAEGPPLAGAGPLRPSRASAPGGGQGLGVEASPGRPARAASSGRGPGRPRGGGVEALLGDRILAGLDGVWRDSLNLAQRLKVSEIDVIAAIKVLKGRGLVASRVVTGGERPCVWGRVER